jgi:Na+/phosphate symporter
VALQILGSLGLLMYGMKMMSDALQMRDLLRFP